MPAGPADRMHIDRLIRRGGRTSAGVACGAGHAWRALAATTAAMLLGCASMPDAAPAAPGSAALADTDQSAQLAERYAGWVRRGERVYRFDPAISDVRIYVFRSGIAARLGHDHILSAPEFIAYAHMPPGHPVEGGFDLQLRLDRLRVDDAALRAKLGGAFATPLDEADVAGTREHMLGDDYFQAARYPYVRVRTVRLIGAAAASAAQVEIVLHGRSRELWLPLQVELDAARIAVAGSFVLRQSDFDVKPFSILGGAIAVQDEIILSFRLAGALLP